MIRNQQSNSDDDDRPVGLKFTRTNFFNFPKRESLKSTKPSSSSTSSTSSVSSSSSSIHQSPLMMRNFDDPHHQSTCPSPPPVLSPSLPTRSPFRARDSQQATKSVARPQDESPTVYSSISSSSSSSIATVEDDLCQELENMWKFKSMTPQQPHTKVKTEMTSEDMLMQLLVSHAMIDAREYNVLTFEEYETLKKHHTRLKNRVENSISKLELDRKIQETSYSLSNLSSDKNRESVMLLLDEALETDKKVRILTQRLNELQSEQVEAQYQILKHTAGVLCLGLQKLENSHQSTTGLVSSPFNPTSPKQHLNDLHAQLDTITQALKTMLLKYDSHATIHPHALANDLLDQLESQLLNHPKSISMSTKAQVSHQLPQDDLFDLADNNDDDTNDRIQQLESELSIAKESQQRVEKELETDYAQVAQLKATVANMEQQANKIKSQAAVFLNKEQQLKKQVQQYRDDVSQLRIDKEKWERTMKRKTVIQTLNDEGPAPEELEAKYEQQLEEQEQEYQAQLKEQAAFLDKTTRQCEQLQQEHDKLSATCRDLELLIRNKQKTLDSREVQINQLESELRQQQMLTTQGDGNHQELQQLQAVFSEKETAWIEQSVAMEANFEGILKEFDRLTGTATEFETDKLNYESRIEKLAQQVQDLESSLALEKTRNVGETSDTPTTASLRKEFRKMITDMKADHQRTLDREAEEKTRLEKQLKDLKHEREMSRYERMNKGVQTLFMA